MNDFNTRIVVDGNDGTGKTTLVRSLTLMGFRNVLDRGEMTHATDDPSVKPLHGTVYILLVCPWETSYYRLIHGDRDMTDPYHQPPALIKYDKAFRDLAEKFGALVIDNQDPSWSLRKVLSHLNVPISIGMPTGRLRFDHPAHDFFNSMPARQLVCQSPVVPVTAVYIRTKTYPQMVALGELDVAVVGSDALMGNPWADQCEVIERVAQPGRTVVIAGMSRTVWAKPMLRVATPYPEWAAKFYGDMGRPCTIFQVAGGSEALVAADIADVCFDIVESGETLLANGLVEAIKVGGLDVCVIRRKAGLLSDRPA
jgi:ATP phosphoribosyltransferase